MDLSFELLGVSDVKGTLQFIFYICVLSSIVIDPLFPCLVLSCPHFHVFNFNAIFVVIYVCSKFLFT